MNKSVIAAQLKSFCFLTHSLFLFMYNYTPSASVLLLVSCHIALPCFYGRLCSSLVSLGGGA